MTGITRTPPRDLVHLLLASLEQLAAAGEVDAACRLAGEACALLRSQDARATQRFNALLHRLTRSADPVIQSCEPGGPAS